MDVSGALPSLDKPWSRVVRTDLAFYSSPREILQVIIESPPLVPPLSARTGSAGRTPTDLALRTFTHHAIGMKDCANSPLRNPHSVTGNVNPRQNPSESRPEPPKSPTHCRSKTDTRHPSRGADPHMSVTKSSQLLRQFNLYKLPPLRQPRCTPQKAGF